MTKQEIAGIINSKATEYGFEVQRYPMGWATCQTSKKAAAEINSMGLSYERTF